jgi:hypothetical protein
MVRAPELKVGGWETTFMRAQAAGDLGAVVRRWKCEIGKWRETGSDLGNASRVPGKAVAERRNISREAG